ncbi:bifunctional alpha,alpha-trehalose-phosphate synthase (UDP-forming)/trehalose-phosphatase [Pedobacter kyonggii]|uniref:Bifunctional alpha,alpha-trehalose-phosphate synthase (UDP-forming)/trehalose-phosphatase n=1 Tax=Pedobacter kyonggii TaxID=1926871 RepID=A0A4Q9H7I5_9SPHI|nr:bifunctional alpha,alpha-trehalose-phosphate synthase (UDP-forming)/trehalose-phosphatase [Pedobacter kyonggii]TBO39789.1 bifunctional alpha,alpha-trehalose-phosphate synthase (UDP-forming)/trehalose-phosphatase [Pedobacter kyonggii]
MQKRLLIVSNRLPISIEKNNEGYSFRQSSGGLVSAVGAYLTGQGGKVFSERLWAGVPDCVEDVWALASLDHTGADYDFIPVFTSSGDYEDYYNGFSNSVLWPLFHYFPSLADYRPDFFEAYKRVNEQFAEKLSPLLHEGDTVWIHDYHLMLLPGLLRKTNPGITIAFFLHIPFPSAELFRVIPRGWQRALLEGVLGADLIGFHTAEYVSHFLKSLELSLGLEQEGDYITYQHREIKADAFPVSIDFGLFDTAHRLESVSLARERYVDIKGDKKMIFSVDRLDYTKGIFNRLRAFEHFLTTNPSYIGKIVFIMVVVPSRHSIFQYSDRKKKIDEFIGRLNSTMGTISWQPVIYQYDHLNFQDLLGLYTACDIALVTPLRDGMNLVAKEFVASRNDKMGVLILSEMAGAAFELTESLLINPNDVLEMGEMIRVALEMDPSEQGRRLSVMRERIRRYDVNAWALDFFTQLNRVKERQKKLDIRFMDAFSKSVLLNAYAESSHRLLLLDYDGTLVAFSSLPEHASPGELLLSQLSVLSLDPRVSLYIISGRDSATLEKWLGHLPIGLIGEHGAKVKAIGGDWTVAIDDMAAGWKTEIRPVMEEMVSRTPGSFIEEKDFSLAWHYRKTEASLGLKRAGELSGRLREITPGLSLDVLDGNRVIEVRNHGINKGRAVENILKEKQNSFILCIGDDHTDEDMFRALAGKKGTFTIKVGNQASLADYNLHSPHVVSSLLSTIIDFPEHDNIVQ